MFSVLKMKLREVHNRAVQDVKDAFLNRGKVCEPFEGTDLVISNGKAPDLLLPEYSALVEIKTINLSKKMIEKNASLRKELSMGNSVAYWVDEFRKPFLDDLKKAREQFRPYPQYGALVVSIDNVGPFLRVDCEQLLLGEEVYHVGVPIDLNQEPFIKEVEFRDRPFRVGMTFPFNREIGAVAFYYKETDIFVVYHNKLADPARRVPPSIFQKDDFQYELLSDRNKPVLTRLIT